MNSPIARILSTPSLQAGISFLFPARWQADLIKIWMARPEILLPSFREELGCLRPLIFQALENARGREQRARLQFERGCFSFYAFRTGPNAEIPSNSFQFLPLLFHRERTLSSTNSWTCSLISSIRYEIIIYLLFIFEIIRGWARKTFGILRIIEQCKNQDFKNPVIPRFFLIELYV